MTSARRQRKLSPRAFALLQVLLVALASLCATVVSGTAQTTERIVVDRRTGLANSGFDPVAYFTEAQPVMGSGEYELSYAGAIWRFHNEGNRAAFAANPEIYRPRFGGYDPIAIARGVSVAGHPEVYLIVRQRLYLFSSREARDLFQAKPAAALAIAERKWPDVLRSLPL